MKSARRLLTVAAALALGLGVAAAPATGTSSVARFAPSSSAVPGVAPAGSEATAVVLDSSGRAIDLGTGDPAPVLSSAKESARSTSASTAEAALFGCTPVSGRDNPHRSSTGVAVSGHGWWDKGTCSNNKAKVYNCLYEWYTDNTWRQKKCSVTKELSPGGGSSNRTTARRDCDNTLQTSWRNHVDVDVVGEIDTGENPMRQADVNCRIY